MPRAAFVVRTSFEPRGLLRLASARLAAQPALDLGHEVVNVDDRHHDVRAGDQARAELPFG